MSKQSPHQFFLILAAVLICGVMGLVFFTQKGNVIHAYLLAINVVTFVIYGFDKRQAIKSKMRVPEVVLHFLAFIGGSPAAGIAQIVFRHKTKKTSFRIVFFLIVAIQITAVLTALYLVYKAA